ncbi:hypothetical protein DYBT9623_04399 [Dyadobacter sp. CECT 9623]|uniref:Uncharacterized protein n=1 Tax=Dyadobacter linearis TaxID=2823330 RepID=A0ABN7RCB9_9BACT|nr:hypothetical protein [Dyadobacter sp. CECT 9623]CAG5072859.1 hypothetical protein DYBT9623_04399 [Dyadobacter sp. CECT 9623]
MKRLPTIIVTSFFLIIILCFIAGWAYFEKIGDGSWNEEIFVWSTSGMLIAMATFGISLILLIIKVW